MEEEKSLNQEVPLETIYRYTLLENARLKAENEQLESKIKKLENSITSFKKWQRKVVERNYVLTTTPQIEGHPIREYKGLVTGETIIGSNVIKDIKASIKDFFGGRSGSYERVLIEAKETSLKEMTARAQSMGANAIVGIDIDYETVGESGSMLMVATSGTAVVI